MLFSGDRCLVCCTLVPKIPLGTPGWGSPRRMRRCPTARSHDIPNQRVDRSIQVTVGPGRLEIAYEVSLTELTLTQDLRALMGSLPGAERSAWLALYGEVTGPLNAKGFAVTVDGQPVTLAGRRISLGG